jgi:SAM-dependent methyltransferase
LPNQPIEQCTCCGSRDFEFRRILWDELVQAWRLSGYERDYIDRQQGLTCRACGSNLRSMALARAICRCYGHAGTFARFVQERSSRKIRLLEINEAGGLTQFLSKLPKHCIGRYPQLDMMRMPYADGVFDLVVHSDTLEHVPEPITGLSECRRVLRPGGYCAVTVPVIVDRMSMGRAGLSASYHDTPDQRGSDFVVQTEYGCDVWRHFVVAGFQECRLFALEFPSALAFVGVR